MVQTIPAEMPEKRRARAKMVPGERQGCALQLWKRYKEGTVGDVRTTCLPDGLHKEEINSR
jgi:hypothetical protein